jgi:hypothetical protein
MRLKKNRWKNESREARDHAKGVTSLRSAWALLLSDDLITQFWAHAMHPYVRVSADE